MGPKYDYLLNKLRESNGGNGGGNGLATASNGLTASGGNVKIGGIINEETTVTIQEGNYIYYFLDVTDQQYAGWYLLNQVNQGIQLEQDSFTIFGANGEFFQVQKQGNNSYWIFRDNRTGNDKEGIKYEGFGEANDSGIGANYSTLKKTSLAPIKYVDDLVSGSINQFDKGFFASEADLLTAFPNTIADPNDRAGRFARVTTLDGDVFYVWDTGDNAWNNTGTSISTPVRGAITGILGDQTDLANVLSNKIDTALNTGNIIVGNNSNVAQSISLSGDATLSANGVLTIANNAITTAKIIDEAITTAKMSDNAVTNGKLNTMPANTVKANVGNVSANPQDVELVDMYIDGQPLPNDIGEIGQRSYHNGYIYEYVDNTTRRVRRQVETTR